MSFDPANDIPALEGKVILVTGGNSGLGKQSVLELARHSPREIWLGARNLTKAEEAIDDIKSRVPNAPAIKPIQLDLASFDSIRRAAQTFSQHSDRLDILMLNAGIMSVPEAVTEDGYEIQFGTNHLGHALLAKLLLPKLTETATLPTTDVRVVVLTSDAFKYAPKEGIAFSILKGTASQISTVARYGQSKLANILFAQEFARRYPQLRIASVMPGVVTTNLANTASDQSFVMRWLWRVAAATIGVNVEIGVLNQLWAATSVDVKSGAYYTPIGKPGSSRRTDQSVLAKRLWEWTEKELEAGSAVVC